MFDKETEWTKGDIWLGGFLVVFFVLLPMLLILPGSTDEEAVETERSFTPIENVRPSSSTKQVTVQTKPSSMTEDELIDKLDRGDYYEYSDYHDGLDGEHSDIDFAEVSDYFKD